MSDQEHEHHEAPQPVMIPFILLCVAILTIWGIGVRAEHPIEGWAGIGLANHSGQTSAPPAAAEGFNTP